MTLPTAPVEGLTFKPLTADARPDFERLFGPRGAYGGCWCMWWPIPRSQFERQQAEGFVEVARPSERRVVLRYHIGDPPASATPTARKEGAGGQ